MRFWFSCTKDVCNDMPDHEFYCLLDYCNTNLTAKLQKATLKGAVLEFRCSDLWKSKFPPSSPILFSVFSPQSVEISPPGSELIQLVDRLRFNHAQIGVIIPLIFWSLTAIRNISETPRKQRLYLSWSQYANLSEVSRQNSSRAVIRATELLVRSPLLQFEDVEAVSGCVKDWSLTVRTDSAWQAIIIRLAPLSSTRLILISTMDIYEGSTIVSAASRVVFQVATFSSKWAIASGCLQQLWKFRLVLSPGGIQIPSVLSPRSTLRIGLRVHSFSAHEIVVPYCEGLRPYNILIPYCGPRWFVLLKVQGGNWKAKRSECLPHILDGTKYLMWSWQDAIEACDRMPWNQM